MDVEPKAVPPPEVVERMVEEDAIKQAIDDTPPVVEPNPLDYPVKFSVIFIGLIAAIGGLCFGYDIGGSGGTFVMDYFREHLGWGSNEEKRQRGNSETALAKSQQSWIAVTFTLGAMVGSMPAGQVADLIGRKFALIIGAAVFTCGAAMQTATPYRKVGVLLAGRVIGGLGIGLMSALTGLYQSELAPVHLRGIMVTTFQLTITTGILLAGLCNVGLKNWKHGWRLSYGGNMFFSVPMIIMMIFCPDSPRYLCLKGRIEEARAALLRVRHEDLVEFELRDIQHDINSAAAEGVCSWKEMFSSENKQLYRSAMGFCVFVAQQITGINAIMFFAPSIITQIWPTGNSGIWGDLVIKGVNWAFTFLTFVLDRFGRIPLLLIGGLGMAVGHLCVALSSAPFAKYETNKPAQFCILIFCCVFIGCFACTWGPLGWVVCNELHNNRARAKGITLSAVAHWALSTIIGRVSPYMYDKKGLGLWGTFLVFSACCWANLCFIYFCIPETGHLAVEDLDAMWAIYKPCKFPRQGPIHPEKHVDVDAQPGEV